VVIWFIGVSGSGKSFYAKKLFSQISKKKKSIYIDGDEVRKYITYKLGYTKKDREKNSLFICDLCNFLEKNGYVVICSILSIFKKHQKRNRSLFQKYIQIYMDVNLKKVIERNNKKIYSKINVVGKDLKFPKPYKSDITIKNKFNLSYKKEIIKIIKKINDK
tara:strand:+ start:406 stop:891 length:486 start_codon:yes stop_codon:yes gene_type:complete